MGVMVTEYEYMENKVAAQQLAEIDKEINGLKGDIARMEKDIRDIELAQDHKRSRIIDCHRRKRTFTVTSPKGVSPNGA